MADLSRDVRLAVDTGKVAVGAREVAKALSSASAKAIVIASGGKKEAIADILHLSNIAGVKVIKFEGGSLELGAVCGKPYSISALAIIEAGNSNILNEEYK